MSVAEFYKADIQSKEGKFINEYWNMSDTAMKSNPHFIYHLFPSKKSVISLTLTTEDIKKIKSSEELQRNILLSFFKTAQFLGFDANIEKEKFVSNGNINNLFLYQNRISLLKMLDFLRVVGLDDYAMSFTLALCREGKKNKDVKKFINDFRRYINDIFKI